MSTTETTTPQSPAADTPQPANAPTPEAIIDQLRVVRTQMAAVTPLTGAQRKILRRQTEMSTPVLQASINVIGVHETVAQAVGKPVEDVHQMQDDWARWTAVEDELRALLNGVSGANLVRRQQLALIASQAYAVSTQLARNPANSVLVPHVKEIKRLRKLDGRKKPTSTPESPSPSPGTPEPNPSAPHALTAETPDKSKA